MMHDVLAAARREDLDEVGQLVVSELVTNALLHAGTAIMLSIEVLADGVLIEVADGSTHLPAERDYAALAGTGRGLALVHQLCQSWGARATSTGKTVWARVADAEGPSGSAGTTDGGPVPAQESTDRPEDVRSGAQARTVRVQLLNVPLLMHQAWHQHAEALMREYLLTRLTTDESRALREHAMASDAMALLHDQIPTPPLPGGSQRLGDVEELLTSLVEPASTLPSSWLEVQEVSIANFQVLDAVIEDAVALAEADELLAAPVQPELRELRRWICAQVDEQSHGAPPVPWAPPSPAALPPSSFDGLAWDTGPVDRSTKALVAADDSNRIIAVSNPAGQLLGYEDPTELLGHRLLVLIPRRFHQAHLAGFTMFLTSGRRPLLDTEVTLPFVRRDGTEVSLRLEVDVVSPVGEQRVFVAELDRPR